MSWVTRVWRAAIVLLGLLFIGTTFAVARDFLGDPGFDQARKSTSTLANLAVMMTAFGVWLEYLRKRGLARGRLTQLDTIEAAIAQVRGRVQALENRSDAK